jgi:hypothetical protein
MGKYDDIPERQHRDGDVQNTFRLFDLVRHLVLLPAPVSTLAG